MTTPAMFQPPMHSYNVFHRRVERPSIAGIGSVPEDALKKEGFCRVLVIAVDFLKVKGEIDKVCVGKNYILTSLLLSPLFNSDLSL